MWPLCWVCHVKNPWSQSSHCNVMSTTAFFRCWEGTILRQRPLSRVWHFVCKYVVTNVLPGTTTPTQQCVMPTNYDVWYASVKNATNCVLSITIAGPSARLTNVPGQHKSKHKYIHMYVSSTESEKWSQIILLLNLSTSHGILWHARDDIKVSLKSLAE